jgi:aerobic-type carbon monoxide dehydrogenase small subunit (CoxS/CutS family)
LRVDYPGVGQFSDVVTVECVVDDAKLSATVPAATALNTFLTGNGHPVNTGCDAGQCGHCLVRLDGELVRSCLVLAAQRSGSKVETARSADPGLAPVRDWMARARRCSAGIAVRRSCWPWAPTARCAAAPRTRGRPSAT